jgi:hypothetical protein
VLAPASVLKAPSWMPKPVAPALAVAVAAGRAPVVVVALGGGAMWAEPTGVPGRDAAAPPLAAAAAAQALEGDAAPALAPVVVGPPFEGTAAVPLLARTAGVAASPGEARP